MKALILNKENHQLQIKEIAEPEIQDSNQIKVEIIEVGICGTDIEMIKGGRVDFPKGKNEIIIGHEMFGKIVAVGKNVNETKVGDYGVLTVRRGCGVCKPCLLNRSDMCETGKYTERGIKENDGFQSEFVIDDEKNFVNIPADIKEFAVLTEPLSVIEKSIDEALKIQSTRLPGIKDSAWLKNKKVLIGGVGAVGLLAAFAFKLRGAEVFGLDIINENSKRPVMLKKIGGKYINGLQKAVLQIDVEIGEMDFVFEAAGVAKLEFQLIDTLGANGIYMVTGIPEVGKTIKIDGGALIKQMVLKNQVIVGSVNASIHHFKKAVDDIILFKEKWGEDIASLITGKVDINNFEDAFKLKGEDDIKTVIQWKTNF